MFGITSTFLKLICLKFENLTQSLQLKKIAIAFDSMTIKVHLHVLISFAPPLDSLKRQNLAKVCMFGISNVTNFLLCNVILKKSAFSKFCHVLEIVEPIGLEIACIFFAECKLQATERERTYY